MAVAVLIQLPVAAQNASNTTLNIKDTTHIAADSTDDGPDEVTSFIDFNMPPEMLMHFKQMSVTEVLAMNEEFQVTQNDENNVPEVITVKLWFDSDHVKGYILYAPLDRTNQFTVSKTLVNIPVEWNCTPSNLMHEQHLVNTIAALRQNEINNKCTGWHMRLPPFPLPPPKVKIVKPKPEKAHKAKPKKKKISKDNTAPVQPNAGAPQTDNLPPQIPAPLSP